MSEHKAKVTKVEPVGDDILAVRARCCGDPTSESVLTVLELHRPDEDIDADIQRHLARIEKQHAARDHAQRHIERLLKG
jgi:hypothetical protein